MSAPHRVDPRRPFIMTPEGRRRIVLPAPDPAGAEPSPSKAPRTTSHPAEWLMAVVHSDRGSLDGHARQAIAAAAILAWPQCGVVALILGDFTGDPAPLGADRVVVVPALDAARFQPGQETQTVSQLIDAYKAKHIFIPDRAGGDGDLGRRLIAAHGDSAAAHVVEINSHDVAIRLGGSKPYAKRPLPRFILLEPGVVDPALPFTGTSAPVRQHNEHGEAPPKGTYDDRGLEKTDASSVAIEEADVVISAGHGVQNIETLRRLARELGAAVGASRVAVDSGKFSKDQQIGATGKTATASTYIAVGISGAVQHLQGIKDCRHVIAINRDASAPIVKRADLTIIGDAEEVMQALLSAIGKARKSGPSGANP